MGLPVVRNSRIALGATLLLLFAIGIASDRTIVAAGERTRALQHANETFVQLARAVAALQEIQSGSRGFALTADNAFLAPRHTDSLRVVQAELVLRQLLAGNAQQEARLAAFELVFRQRFLRADEIVRLRRTRGERAAVAKLVDGAGAELTARLHSVVAEIEGSEMQIIAAGGKADTAFPDDRRSILMLRILSGILVAILGAVVARAVVVRTGAELRFRDQRQLLESVFGSMRDGVIAADRNGRFLLINSAARRMLGSRDLEIPPEAWSERYGVYRPDAVTPLPTAELPLVRAMGGEPSDDVPMMIRPASGAEDRWVHVSGRPLRDGDGALRGGVAIISDTTARRIVERELQQSEARFASLVDSIREDAMFLLDAKGCVASWNAGAERISGYPAAEILGQPVSRLYSSADVALGKPQSELASASRTGRFEGEGWRVRKNGSPFWAGIIVTSMLDEGGAIKGYTAVNRDLNEGRRSESRYRALLEATPDAILIVDQSGAIELANAQMETLFGYSRPELLGRSVDMLLPERLRGTEGALRGGFFQPPRHLALGKAGELFGLRKDGTEFPVEISLSPLETETGMLSLAAIRDGTERARAENRFRALLESAPDAMVVVDAQGCIELANARMESLFRCPRADLLGKSAESLVPERFRETRDGVQSCFFRLPSPASSGEGREMLGLAKDGTEFPVEISLSPLEDASGNSVIAVFRDITRRKLAEEHLVHTIAELKRSNDELEQFAYVTSHDLQEPLRIIASYTQLLAKRYKGRLDADADEFIGFAVDGAARMRGLIQDLLSYSRAGSSTEPAGECSAEDALREALANLEGAIGESGAVVTHDELPSVFISRSQLVQVFQNLLGNAIKYRAAEAPRIHVAAHDQRGERHVFSVRDNGLGIDPQQFGRIFVLFQRLHGRAEFTGTGIGLAICKKLVERQGGRIWVNSEPGQGSTFYFSIPAGPRA